jgi:predicted RNA methylase
MEDLFPRKEGVDLTRLRTTEEGSYSITRRRDAERIMNVFRSLFPDMKRMTITDGTACIGGDTLNFALAFGHVHSIEVNPENFKALTNNVDVYGFTNVTMYPADTIHTFTWNTNILYLDPPWGGKDYRKHAELDLFLSGVRLDVWIEQVIIRRNRPEYVVLKLPVNYNFKRLNFLPNVDAIRPYRIRSYVLVVITIHKPSQAQTLQTR